MLDVQRLRPGDLVRHGGTGDVFVVLLNDAAGAVVVRALTIETEDPHGWEQVGHPRTLPAVQIRAYGEVRNPPATLNDIPGPTSEEGYAVTDPTHQRPCDQ